jgi:hypothetical protein
MRKEEITMKLLRLGTILTIFLLAFTSGLVLAQDDPILVSPDPAFDPPIAPLHACAVDDTELQACDMIATQPEDIIGVWTLYFNAEAAFIRYNADGTWVIADTVEHTAGAPIEGFPYGIYSFDADGMFTNSSPDIGLPEECVGGQYILHVIKVGDQPVALNHAVRDDCFAPRRTDWAYSMLWVGAE